MYNLKHLKQGLQAPLTLLSHTQSEVECRLGSRSARGCATELGLFLLPWHCRLAPSSICSFGTYSCNDYKQSLIKLQRTLPRNPCVSVCGDDHLDCSFLFLSVDVSVLLKCQVLLRYASLCELICMHLFTVFLVHCHVFVLHIVMLFAGLYACVWLIGAYHNSRLSIAIL